jgi:HD superfamily phosphohydrolase
MWGNPYDVAKTGNDRVKTFTIPVSGSVLLYGPEVAIVETAEFQRLAGIKQLGTSYVTFRGAIHTRFEHSLGALHQAERMLTSIASNPRSGAVISKDARRLARLGSLLHDLPHVPFGHTLEDEFQLLARHDVNKQRIDTLLVKSEIGSILKAAIGRSEFAELQRVLHAKEDKDFAKLRHPFVGDIVGNTVCADLLDYVQRDLAACGMPAAIGDRFLDYLTVTDESGRKEDRRRIALNLDKRGMPRPDVESEVIKLLAYRYELAERVYFHHAKNAASVMIARSVQEAGFAVGANSPDTCDENFHWLSDEMLLQCLATPAVEQAVGLRVTRVGDRALASQLAHDVLRRRLFKIAFIGVHDDLASGIDRIAGEYSDPERRAELEDRLADLAGLPAGQVLVHIPRRKMMRKTADVRVRTHTGEIITLNTWDEFHSRRVHALNEAHVRLWRVTVFVHRDAPEDAVRLARAAAQDEFGAGSRYVEVSSLPTHQRELFELHREDREWTNEDLAFLEAHPPAALSVEAGTAAGVLAVIAEQIKLGRRTRSRRTR